MIIIKPFTNTSDFVIVCLYFTAKVIITSCDAAYRLYRFELILFIGTQFNELMSTYQRTD